MKSAEPDALRNYADTDKSGSPETVIYFTHDANMNLTAALEADGDILERYEYTAYGQVGILNGAAFGSRRGVGRGSERLGTSGYRGGLSAGPLDLACEFG
jgi:hypothetical protein